MKKQVKIGILGSGNMAYCLGKELKNSGFIISEIYSRNAKEGKKLSKLLTAQYISKVEKLSGSAEIYFFCLQDEAIEIVSKQFLLKDKIMVHTSGSIPLSVFKKKVAHYGVFYPVQSFSKDINPNWNEIPICIEATDLQTEKIIKGIAKKISSHIYSLDSSQRRMLHLSAVFANNFANACFSMSEEILNEAKIPFTLLRPLILNTALKVQNHYPCEVQTGPAVRNDLTVIKSHEQLLSKHVELKKIYTLLTKYIKANTK